MLEARKSDMTTVEGIMSKSQPKRGGAAERRIRTDAYSQSDVFMSIFLGATFGLGIIKMHSTKILQTNNVIKGFYCK